MSVLIIFLTFVCMLTIAARLLLRAPRRPPIHLGDHRFPSSRRMRLSSLDIKRRG